MPTTFELGDGRRVVLARYVEHDPASRAYPAEAAAGVGSVRWNPGPVLDQGEIGSCTGNAAVGVLNSSPVHADGAGFLVEADALRVYELATRMDRIPGCFPPADTGSTGLAAAKAAKRLGWLAGGYSHAFGIQHLLGALQYGPVMVGTVWTQDMFTPDGRGRIVPTGAARGGHEYEVYAYDRNGELFGAGRQMLAIRNSWSEQWGIGGDALISVTDMSDLLDDHGDVTALRPAATTS